jgi:transcription initiation factor TFIIIB Brf1 subunit/transcription initiation factor TFIIB
MTAPLKEWLNCPCCGEDMLEKDAPALWYEDEEEVCPDCGCTVSVSVDDDDDPPRAYTVVRKGCPEHGEVE